ncbi:MAG: hypothetical protein AB4372_40670 [Xenococcus sp. (in: cyanobacteria)]
MGKLLLPGDPGFYETLHSRLPPGWIDRAGVDFANAFAVRAESYCLEPLSQKELDEYLYGGEYDELEEYESGDSNF